MSRHLIALFLFCQAAVVLVGAGPEAEDRATAESPRSMLREAGARTAAAGSARIDVAIRSGSVHYRLRGRLDPAHGYRVCAAIRAAPNRYLRRRTLWVEERRGDYGTLTAYGHRCLRDAGWLDDHPPALQLFRGPAIDVPAGGRTGAEDFLHAALLALKGLSRPAHGATRARPCGRSRCYRAVIDFEALDREPWRRDEDGWTLRPLLRSLGRHGVEVRVNGDGFVDRLGLAAPGHLQRGPNLVRVKLRLWHIGEAASVPGVSAIAYE